MKKAVIRNQKKEKPPKPVKIKNKKRKRKESKRALRNKHIKEEELQPINDMINQPRRSELEANLKNSVANKNPEQSIDMNESLNQILTKKSMVKGKIKRLSHVNSISHLLKLKIMS